MFPPIVPYLLRHPYIILFYTLIGKFAEWQYDCGIAGRTEWVFDSQDAIGKEALVWYSQMKELQTTNLREKWGDTPVFRNDRDVLPLQAADLVAWHRRRRVEFPIERASSLPTAALEDLTYADVPIPEVYLTEIASGMAKVPGVMTVHEKPRGYRPGLPLEEVYGDIPEL